MCFSATASFGAAAVLIPAGVYCLKQSHKLKQPYWLIALLPLVFGLQQVFEGFVWLDLASLSPDPRLPALGFMFFSHFFWLLWVPLACFAVETNPLRRRLFMGVTALGTIHGLLMYVPLWIHPDWLSVEINQHSISYKATLLYDEYIPRILSRVLYALIVLIPLLLSSQFYVRLFGVIIFFSVAFATIFYGYAFISVWCFFAALLSLYILYMISQLKKAQTQI